jgi:hypothetical protein
VNTAYTPFPCIDARFSSTTAGQQTTFWATNHTFSHREEHVHQVVGFISVAVFVCLLIAFAANQLWTFLATPIGIAVLLIVSAFIIATIILRRIE